jgi:type VI secretion system secreted protein VgrG
VLRLAGREEVSRPFRYEIDFAGSDVDLDAAPGSRVQLELDHPSGHQRWLSGVCSEISIVGLPAEAKSHRTRYRAILVPEAVLTFSLRHGFRIFQEKSAVEILQKMWKEAGLDSSLLDVSGLTGHYLPREFCVQYDESEWDFVCRLLEDEGIFFSFKQAREGHVMCLGDQSAHAEALSPQTLGFNPEPQAAGNELRVWDWRKGGRLCPTNVDLSDFNPLKPSLDLHAHESASDSVKRGWYEWPGGYTDPREGARRAKVRLHELRAPRQTNRAKTNAVFAEAGRSFKLSGHPHDDGDYFLTAVDIDLRIDESAEAAPLAEAGAMKLQIGLEVMPSSQAFRPLRRTPRRRAPGLQTARITGPKGAEIHCDSHGRVKLQFPWDRDGQLDDHSSCWVRVSQPHTTGSILIPRVGWEVLVEFVDGDPDRPVCLGKVWNPFFTPPADLPAAKAQTNYASLSSPGGGGTNEIRMDDTAGSEQVSIRAQHDMLVKAANNKLFNVGNNASQTVHGKRSAKVGGNDQAAIKADQNFKVGGSHTVQVGALRTVKVSGSATEEVAGAFALTVGGAEMVQVGNPAHAVLEVIKQAAISAAQGAADAAANRAQAAVLGPIMPALSKAKQALGPGAKLAGPAASLLGAGDPTMTGIHQAAETLGGIADAKNAGDLAAGMAQLALEGAPALPGGGGGGGGAGPDGPSGPTGGGSGTWATIVGGSVSETIGGLAATNALKGISLAVGGSSMETVGAARLELIGGGKVESTGGAKAETVGVYKLDIQESFAVTAGAAAAENVAGVEMHRIAGSHSMSAKGPVRVTAPTLKLKGAGVITLSCGSTKVVIKSGGIFVEGDASLTIEGSNLEVDEGALGP